VTLIHCVAKNLENFLGAIFKKPDFEVGRRCLSNIFHACEIMDFTVASWQF